MPCAKRIRLVTDELPDDDSTIVSVRRMIESADHIVFVGFAFDHRNLKRLGLSGLTRAAPGHDRLYGTSFGMTGGNIARVTTTLAGIDLRQQKAHEFVQGLALIHGISA